jgi:addiction module HigA family antidote
MLEKKMLPVHPGEILLEDFLKPMGISQYRLAMNVGVHPRRINAIVHGQRRITADTALRLARFFNTSAEVWMNLQSQYDLDIAREEMEEQLAKQIQPYAVALDPDG